MFHRLLTIFSNGNSFLSLFPSLSLRSLQNIGNYAFGYNEDHTTGGTFRRESGDAHGNKVGSYGLRDADGRLRIVNYVADALGFRANIQTNEPGVEPKDPAATLINKVTFSSFLSALWPSCTLYCNCVLLSTL